MRIEAMLWTGVTVHFTVIATLYLLLDGEPAGVSLLFVSAGFGGLVAGWTWDWRRRHAQLRPEDRVDGDAVDAVGVVGVYPTASLRPLGLSVGMTAMALGVVLGSWMLLAGVAIVSSQVALLVRDADR